MEESNGVNIMMRLMTSNYSIWKPRMKDMLFWHDLEDTIWVIVLSHPIWLMRNGKSLIGKQLAK